MRSVGDELTYFHELKLIWKSDVAVKNILVVN